MKIDFNKMIFNSGDFFLPEFIKNFLSEFIYKYPNTSRESDYIFYIQWWSIVHLINGIIVGYLYLYFGYNNKRYFINMLIFHIIWEIWQIIIGMSNPYNIIGRNGLIDTTVDTILFMIGASISFCYNK
jgi:hypothetical protein